MKILHIEFNQNTLEEVDLNIFSEDLKEYSNLK
jgi:hypothetical protein